MAARQIDDGQAPMRECDGTGGINAGIVRTAVCDPLRHALDQGGIGRLAIDDFNSGAPVESMYAAFQLRIGGRTATPADGLAFVWGSDVNSGTEFGEEGSGNGLIVSMDTYVNNATDPIGIAIRWNGTQLAERVLPIETFLSDPDYSAVKTARDSLTHSRVRRHFSLGGSGVTPRLEFESQSRRVPARQLVEISVLVAERHVLALFAELPTL